MEVQKRVQLQDLCGLRKVGRNYLKTVVALDNCTRVMIVAQLESTEQGE